jgi:phage baseplate assembly protein W
MPDSFLGTGWKFPLELDTSGGIAMASDEASIRQSIWLILSTAPGERVMRPDFGCGIHDLVFAPNTAGTAGQIINEVREALIRWEPRIDVLAVDAIPDDDQPNLLRIAISYQVRTTNNRFNLVYPFYLET